MYRRPYYDLELVLYLRIQNNGGPKFTAIPFKADAGSTYASKDIPLFAAHLEWCVAIFHEIIRISEGIF